MQAQYGHRAIKCYLREFCECKNGGARIILSAPRISQTVTLFNNLRWLNTVVRAVRGNSRDGACFK